jgi:membrane protease YdiL (CAAX protease family)
MALKAYPGVKGSILLCLILLGLQAGLDFIVGILLVVFGFAVDSPAYGIATAIAQFLSLGLAIFIGFRKTRKTFNQVFKFNGVSPSLWLIVIVFMLGFFFVISELDSLLNFVLPMPDFLQSIFASMTVDQGLILSIVLIIIIPGFMEELLCRGVILDGLRENYSPVKAIVVSALLFGLVHLNPWQFVGAFLIGLFSAWICLNTNSIWPSIYIHLFNNLLSLITSRYPRLLPMPGFNASGTEVGEFQPLWLDAIALAVVIAGFLWLRKKFAASKAAVSAPAE